MKDSNLFLGTIIAVIVLEILSIILGLASELTYLESSRVVFGSVFVLFLPGFVWSFVFFPSKPSYEENGIDFIERIALSFALSIAIVPLVVFYLNLIGLKIGLWNTFFVVLGLIVLGWLVAWMRKKRH